MILSLPSCPVNKAEPTDQRCVQAQDQLSHLPLPSETCIAEVIFQASFTWTLASSLFVRGASVVAWARGSIGKTVRTLCYNNKHICARNLDNCVRVAGWLSCFLTSVYVFVHYDLGKKRSEKKISKGCRILADCELQIFLSGSDRVKIFRAINLPHTSRFLSRLTTLTGLEPSQFDQNQDGAFSIDVTLIPNWLRRARATQIVLVHRAFYDKCKNSRALIGYMNL